MKTYIFGGEYDIYAAQANSESEALEKIKASLTDKQKNSFEYDTTHWKDWANGVHVVEEGGVLICSHSNA